MSTYQYYEFLAVDGPIDEEGLRYAQSCSSRAEVSRFRWTNSYHWGDFSGSEERLLRHYDAFLYFADWGSFRFSLAFPEDGFPKESIEPYLTGSGQEFGATLNRAGDSTRPVLTWGYHEDAVCWDEQEDLAGLLGRLSGIREQIMRGDHRALFLAWLANFDPEWMEDEERRVPPIPPGMDQLTDALHCLAKQIEVDDEALRAAIELSAGRQLPESRPIAEVVDALPVSEMKRLLVRVAEGAESRVKVELIQKTRPRVTASNAEPITCGAFAKWVLKVREELERERAKKKAEKKREDSRRRREHLDRVFQQSEAVWKRLDQWLVKKSASAYDTASEQVKELRDAYVQAGDADGFAERLLVFRGRYGRRPALMRRLENL